ncbi:glycosyltransferase [Lentilitoribacter sp. EG35]|uniref:glycosyltransferase n=1 Tax=Lentilitoribacter sp. EG35 TaxID=3234192 RepID=UPI00345F200D
MTKKSIVFAIFTLQGNGAERVVITLATAMLIKGHDVHIICFKDHIDFDVDSRIPIHIFPYQKFRVLPKFMRTFFASRAFDQFVGEQIGRPHLILSNLEPVDAILSSSKLKNIFFIIHNTLSKEYADKPRQLQQALNFYRQKSCISVSKGVGTDLKKLLKNEVTNRVIYNPVDPLTISNLADNENAKTDQLGEYIINVGGFKSAKRHDRLLEAFSKSSSNAKLVLLGKGKLLEETQELAKKLKISDRVIFMGFQSNAYPFIKAAKALVVSSDFEGLGMTILEALALGVPVISTDCPSGPSEILPQRNLSPVNDVDLLSRNITDVLKNADKYRAELKEDFLIEKCVEKYLALASG